MPPKSMSKSRSSDLARNRINSVASVEFISPAPGSGQRVSTMPAAVFNLVSTIIGGGILSLPYAFATTGLILGPLMMIAAGMMADFSVYLLVASSRRSGANSYEEVVKVAFGLGMQVFTMVLLVFLIILAIIAYMKLTNDLMVPVVEFAAGTEFSDVAAWAITGGMVLLTFPLCLMKSMTQLKFVSMFSVATMGVLAIAISYEFGWGLVAMDGIQAPLLATDNLEHILYCFPIILVAFVCHFNVLPVHTELIDPTRTRIQCVFHFVMLVCSSLYLLIGTLGALQFGKNVCPDILSNYPSNNVPMTIGRLGVGFTVILSLPLLVQPARRTLLEAVRLCSELLCVRAGDGEEDADGYDALHSPLLRADSDFDGTSNMAPDSPYYQVGGQLRGDVLNLDMAADDSQQPSGREMVAHVVQTLLIMGGCFFVAVLIPQITVVWNLLGSSVSIIIAFILPSACYIKIRAHKAFNRRKLGAWALLIFGILACIACTYQSIHSLLHPRPIPDAC